MSEGEIKAVFMCTWELWAGMNAADRQKFVDEVEQDGRARRCASIASRDPEYFEPRPGIPFALWEFR